MLSLILGMSGKKDGRKYRGWSEEEDAKLLDALVHLVNVGGYKADNGFRNGHLLKLEEALKVSLPDKNILAKPHIESRIKTMKKAWQTVHDMLHGTNTSGFGYDSVKKCVTADDSVWDAYLQVHQGAAKWRNKPFPHYEDMCYIFGKDRAHGNQARDFYGIDEDVAMEDNELPSEKQQSEENVECPPEDSQMPSQECTSVGSRKRKSRGDPLVDAIKNAAVILGDRLEKASDNLVKLETEIHEKKSMVGSELAKMDLTSMERFRALRKITRDTEAVLSFWDYEGEAREEFVRYMLQE